MAAPSANVLPAYPLTGIVTGGRLAVPCLLACLHARPLTPRLPLPVRQVARVRNEIHSLERRQLLGAVVQAGLPVLVGTGENDHVTPPAAASR